MRDLTKFIKAYWRFALSALGAIVLAMPAFFVFSLSTKVAMGIAGAFFVLSGAILEKISTRTNEELDAENIKLKDTVSQLIGRRIFVVLASFKEEWQSDLNYHLLTIAQSHGLFCDVFCPKSCFNHAEQAKILKTITESKHRFSGGLVVVTNFRNDYYKEVNDFAKDVGVPVVFMDNDPPQAEGRTSEDMLVENVGWVTVLNEDGGRLAATFALSFGHLDRILVVGGPWKKIRQLSFKKEIRRKQPHCDVTIRECEAFDKEIAEREVLRELSAAIRNGQMYDAIFCVTDSLTIGCIEAISQISWGQIKQPKVIGYDGTPAVKQMILDNRTSLQGVIVQNAEEVANLAVLTLMDLQGPKRRERIAAVAPSVFPKYLLK